MANWRSRGAVGLTVALSLGLLISTTSGFSQAEDRLPDVLTCEQFAASPAAAPAAAAPADVVTVQVPAGALCELTAVALPGDLVVQPGGLLILSSSTVAGTLSAESAARVTLTDVAVAGAVSATATGTVPGPVLPVDPAAPVDPTVVVPVIELTRVDAESTIDLTGTVGNVVIAGTDLLGNLTVADTTGDLVLAAATRPDVGTGTDASDPAAGPADPSSAGTDSGADAPVSADPGAADTASADTDSADTASTDPASTDTGPADAASADPASTDTGSADLATAGLPAVPSAELPVPPVRTVVGSDLTVARTTGAIVVDGTSVTGQVRLESNTTAALFGPETVVVGGVVEVQPETTAPTAPTTPAPTTTVPGEGGTGPSVTPPNDVDPTDVDPTDGTTGPTDDPATDDQATDESGTDHSTTDDRATDDSPTTEVQETDGSSTDGTSAPVATGAQPTVGSADNESSAAAVDPETSGIDPTAPGRPALPEGLTVDFGSSAVVDLGSLRPVHGILTAEGSLSPVALTDTRPGAPGWTVSAQLTDFAGGNRSFDAANLGWTPKLIDGPSGAEVGPTVAPGGSGEGLSVNRRLGSAGPGEGSGTTVLGADLQLRVTDPVDPGTYTATLVITVLS